MVAFSAGWQAVQQRIYMKKQRLLYLFSQRYVMLFGICYKLYSSYISLRSIKVGVGLCFLLLLLWRFIIMVGVIWWDGEGRRNDSKSRKGSWYPVVSKSWQSLCLQSTRNMWAGIRESRQKAELTNTMFCSIFSSSQLKQDWKCLFFGGAIFYWRCKQKQAIYYFTTSFVNINCTWMHSGG